ncbi:hypothetical protein KP005_05860 [Geomonas nitrogeniifigens]|uniref:Uncharacterized protein n=1 Tax=Geomonas diazotrophica TaxID=2843197 RepID=A0ABX8JK95_9BACT|nr:hypothetical protein [Geomonas nitrogeniifigens]QWV98809.1 hypothetical protein KP005_05860 [Geomonas nitrogeniifigens]
MTYQGLCGRVSNALIYVLAIISFLALPIAFYCGIKFAVPLYKNAGAILCAVPTFFLIVQLIKGRTLISVSDAGISCHNYFVSSSLKTYEWGEVENVEATQVPDTKSISLVMNLKGGDRLWILNSDEVLIGTVKGRCRNFFEKPIDKKSDYRVAGAAIGIVLLEVLLTFGAIYLAT